MNEPLHAIRFMGSRTIAQSLCLIAVMTVQARGQYSGTLVLPSQSGAYKQFSWSVSGTIPKKGPEIGHVELSGIWKAADVLSVDAVDNNNHKIPASIHTNGSKVNIIETGGLQDKRLPVTITVTFNRLYFRASSGTDLFVKAGGAKPDKGQTGGIHFDAAGPSTQSPIVLFTNPSDPAFARATTIDNSVVTVFGNRDASGLPEVIRTIRIVSAGGLADQYDFDELGRPLRIIASNGVWLVFEWTAEFALVTAITPDGHRVIVQWDLSSAAARVTFARTAHQVAPPDLAALAASASQRCGTVQVTRCEKPVSNANVLVYVVELGEAIPALRLAGTQGTYKYCLPDPNSLPNDFEEVCTRVKESFEHICTFFDFLGKTNGALDTLCESLSSVDPRYAEACLVLGRMDKVCSFFGDEFNDNCMAIADFLNRAINEVSVTPQVSIAGVNRPNQLDTKYATATGAPDFTADMTGYGSCCALNLPDPSAFPFFSTLGGARYQTVFTITHPDGTVQHFTQTAAIPRAGSGAILWNNPKAYANVVFGPQGDCLFLACDDAFTSATASSFSLTSPDGVFAVTHTVSSTAGILNITEQGHFLVKNPDGKCPFNCVQDQAEYKRTYVYNVAQGAYTINATISRHLISIDPSGVKTDAVTTLNGTDIGLWPVVVESSPLADDQSCKN